MNYNSINDKLRVGIHWPTWDLIEYWTWKKLKNAVQDPTWTNINRLR